MSGFFCPVSLSATETVLLGHGSCGKLSSELLHSVFLPAFDNPHLARLDDQDVLEFGAKGPPSPRTHSWLSLSFSAAGISARWPCTAR